MTANPARRVLDVGQCDPDHAGIARLLKENFEVTVDRAKSSEQVDYMMGFYDYDLVLVNRIFDADGSEGLELIKQLKSGERRGTPVMLVSNYADAQEQAQALGALPGFGKSQLTEPQTLERIQAVLGAA
ncbi:MAG TPA: hypothetical protein P5572_04760 [Phycisphaerae bacterium]|nr:hypothetical protein [Phycisphaerae bacterium]